MNLGLFHKQIKRKRGAEAVGSKLLLCKGKEKRKPRNILGSPSRPRLKQYFFKSWLRVCKIIETDGDA